MTQYHYATISELHAAYKDGRLTIRELVLIFLSRIAEIDKGDNGLNAVLEINPDALFIADTLDAKLKSGANGCSFWNTSPTKRQRKYIR